MVAYNPYPEETVSVCALPSDSPILYLGYGILTVIGEIVKEKRLVERNRCREYLVKHTRAPLLKAWLHTLHKLGKQWPEIAVVNLTKHRKKGTLKNKKGMLQIIEDQDIPLASLEYICATSCKENTFKVGDKLKIKQNYGQKKDFHLDFYYGICTRSSRTRVYAHLVHMAHSNPVWNQRQYLQFDAGRPITQAADISQVEKIE